jgi:hypothetical protein
MAALAVACAAAGEVPTRAETGWALGSGLFAAGS